MDSGSDVIHQRQVEPCPIKRKRISSGLCLLWYREAEEGKMAEMQITFHNKAAIRVQAQIFTGRNLVSTCVAGPGEIRTLLPAESAPYDIFFKHGTTGWEIARKLGCEAVDFTLSQVNGQYILT
jgi:hypothetical protein